MDISCLEYGLTEGERGQFEEQGFLVIEEALPPKMVEELVSVVDWVDTRHRQTKGLGPHDKLSVNDFLMCDDLFLELLDWPRVFPKIWGILGWNIQVYHLHLSVVPPGGKKGSTMEWHQDSDRLNRELETDPRPRVSVKAAFFLSDTTAADRGNFCIIPGSHLWNNLDLAADGDTMPDNALSIQVKPGTAVIFDRRLWHRGTPNRSEVPRKVLFYGYSYRWLRPRCDLTVSHLMKRIDPIRQQLLGAGTGGLGYTSPQDEDVPLRAWLRDHVGEAAVL